MHDDWFSADVATFGDRLAAAREHAGLSQAQLASRLGVKTSTIRKWEEDLGEPRANRLSMLAGILGVSMMWLINGEGEGVSAPDPSTDLPEGTGALLNELRELRVGLMDKAQRIARLEKMVARAIRNAGDG